MTLKKHLRFLVLSLASLLVVSYNLFAQDFEVLSEKKLEDTSLWQEMEADRKYEYEDHNQIRDILDPAEESEDYQKIITGKSTDPKTPLEVFFPKKQTPTRIYTSNLSMPVYFGTSNNLTKKVGAFYHSFGELIFLKGTVTNSFGVPIDGAIIEIWQTNAAGKYHTLLDKSSEYVDKYFNMSGRAVTNNLGEYSFITIMPGSYSGRSPHINMNIYHKKFGVIETEIYFEKHPLNKDDYQYLAYSKEDREALTAKVRHSNIMNPKSTKICTFNITMTGVYQYKNFGGPLR